MIGVAYLLHKIGGGLVRSNCFCTAGLSYAGQRLAFNTEASPKPKTVLAAGLPHHHVRSLTAAGNDLR